MAFLQLGNTARARCMPAASAAQTSMNLSASPAVSEAAEFYSILFHDDRKSHAILATRRAGLWSEESLSCSQLPYLRANFIDTNDHYVTVNSFAGRRRDVNRCRQVNAIMLDIDVHDGNHGSVVPALRRKLEGAVSEGAIPAPNIVVDSGRGLQIYYVLEKSIPYRLKSGVVNDAVLEFLADVRRMLATLMESALVSHVAGADLDRSVFDLTRVSRIPGSYNTAAGRRAAVVSTSREYWSLSSLKEACNIVVEKPVRPTHKAQVYRFDRLQMSRMAKIEELVAYREAHGGCQGTRDLCLFVYYNSATQVAGPEEALRRTHVLNQRLTAPLPTEDIKQIARTVDSNTVLYGAARGRKGFYPLSMETVIAKLRLTAEEISATNFFASKRATERSAAKVATASRRAERDARICKLYGNGFTQVEVAAVVGCSIGTVSAVVRREGVTFGSAKARQLSQMKEAVRAKQQRNSQSNGNISFFRHTSWGCGLPSLSWAAGLPSFPNSLLRRLE